MGIRSSVPSALNHKGYPRINSGARRDQYLHRAVFEEIAGRPVREGFDIHHMNGKRCFCPDQLIEIQKELHPAPQPLRCPITGQYLTPEGFHRRFGVEPLRATG
jgi:hypothetical protein